MKSPLSLANRVSAVIVENNIATKSNGKNNKKIFSLNVMFKRPLYFWRFPNLVKTSLNIPFENMYANKPKTKVNAKISITILLIKSISAPVSHIIKAMETLGNTA